MMRGMARIGGTWTRIGRAAFAACVAALGACRSVPPVAEDLAYPVLVLFEQSGSVRHDDPADLRRMSVQRVIHSHSAPWLIDARLDLYRVEKLQSVHGGFWLMANPSGPTEVSFELVRVARADAVQARRLIVEREPILRAEEVEALRQRLEGATTLAAMLDVLGK
jgi:hypothetical protein